MNKAENIKNIIKIEISRLKPFEEDNADMEKTFFYLSELAGDLKLNLYRDLCLELSLYCKGSETGEFAYKNKEEILKILNKIGK